MFLAARFIISIFVRRLSNNKIMKSKDMAKVFKALSNEQRLNLFRMIYYWQKTMPKAECCGVQKAFTRACDCMNLTRSTISHHLKELSNADLISTERKGKFVVARINQQTLKEFSDVINLK